jgi:predicted ATPase
MINKVVLKNFKLFKEETSIPLSNINLLTGINGRGKSTVLQAFLLMKQSPGFDRTTNKLILNGEDVSLGGFIDIRNVRTRPISFKFIYDNFFIKYDFQENIEDPMVADIKQVTIRSIGTPQKFEYKLKRNKDAFKLTSTYNKKFTPLTVSLYDMFISETSLALNKKVLEDCNYVNDNVNFSKVHYVSSDRIGPQLYHHDKTLKGFFSVGPRGEDAVMVLYHSKNKPVGKKFINNLGKFFHVIPEEIGTTVELQVGFWLDKLFSGAKYEIKPIPSANLLTFKISPDGGFEYFTTTNVGYGYSHVLPLLVAGLIAEPGEILIVENPEAHLHPHAQSMIAKFLTLVSLNDVQVIIESHSEHILNGLRIPVYNGVIPNSHLNVLYFARENQKYFKKIFVNEKGGISDWPQDFFDQATRDLNYLFGF